MKVMRRAHLIVAAAAVAVLAGCSEPAPPTVAVPGVVGDDVASAVEQIEAAGLVAEIRDGDPDPGAREWWVVKNQRPGATAGEVEEGSTVQLYTESVLDEAVARCGVPTGSSDGGRSLILDNRGSDAGSGALTWQQVECTLEELDVPESVLSRMLSTRALDGRQDAEWGGLRADWSYHPDNGLDVIIEVG